MNRLRRIWRRFRRTCLACGHTRGSHVPKPWYPLERKWCTRCGCFCKEYEGPKLCEAALWGPKDGLFTSWLCAKDSAQKIGRAWYCRRHIKTGEAAQRGETE